MGQFKINLEVSMTRQDIEINIVDKNGETPLHSAVRGKHIEVVRALVSHKDKNGKKDINVNTTSKSTFSRGIYTDTPLHAAVSTDNVELVGILLANGAGDMINVKCGAIEVSDGRTPFEIAKQSGSQAMIDCLSGRVGQSISLDGELDQIEAVVVELENNIRNREISVENLKRQIQGIADSDTIMAKIRANDIEWITALQKEFIRRSGVDKINIMRLSKLKDLHPDDTRIRQLGSRAVKCLMALHEIGLSACEMMCTPDFRLQMQSGNREILKSLEEMLTKIFPVEKNSVPKPPVQKPADILPEYNQSRFVNKEQAYASGTGYFDILTKKYAKFDGRASRKEYWGFTLVNLAISIIFYLIFGKTIFLALFVIFWLFIFLPSLALTVRRLHDIGQSGWLVLLNLIPYAGGLIVLVLMLLDSEKRDNKYGPNNHINHTKPEQTVPTYQSPASETSSTDQNINGYSSPTSYREENFNKLLTGGAEMAQYKVVQGPKHINIGHDGNPREAINQFQSVIDRESSGGWELVCTHTIRVTQNAPPVGCFGMLLVMVGLAQKPESSFFDIDLLIFAKK